MHTITHITPIDAAPAGFSVALFDRHADCHLRGHYRTAFVRAAENDMVDVIELRNDGDFSGLILRRHKSFTA